VRDRILSLMWCGRRTPNRILRDTTFIVTSKGTWLRKLIQSWWDRRRFVTTKFNQATNTSTRLPLWTCGEMRAHIRRKKTSLCHEISPSLSMAANRDTVWLRPPIEDGCCHVLEPPFHDATIIHSQRCL